MFPRNQVLPQYLPVVAAAGFKVYRGNPDHWVYRDGHVVPYGKAGRAIRYADSWLSLTGTHAQEVNKEGKLLNVPASLFLRPLSGCMAALEPLRLARLKAAMTDAARRNKICHLWWHPHNFGVNADKNLAVLEALLKHYLVLKDQYGMRSVCMGDFAAMGEL